VRQFDQLADEIEAFLVRVDDAIFNAIRAQMRNESAEEAKDLEKRLSKVRRSLRKAEQILRGESKVEDD
jgi:hypothetical protein